MSPSALRLRRPKAPLFKTFISNERGERGNGGQKKAAALMYHRQKNTPRCVF